MGRVSNDCPLQPCSHCDKLTRHHLPTIPIPYRQDEDTPAVYVCEACQEQFWEWLKRDKYVTPVKNADDSLGYATLLH